MFKGKSNCPFIPDIVNRESILVSFRMDPRFFVPLWKPVCEEKTLRRKKED
jgi:hypothetical protein